MGKDIEFDQEFEQLKRMYEVGKFLRGIRTEKGLTLEKISETLNVSSTFISDVERGKKSPSDQLIRGIANVYEVNEDELFTMYGKVPLVSRDELSRSKTIQNTLGEIARNKKLTDENKEEIYNELHRIYKKMIDEIKQ